MFSRQDPYGVASIEPAPAPGAEPRPAMGKWRAPEAPPPTIASTKTIVDGGKAFEFGDYGTLELAVQGSVEGNGRQQLWLEVWDEDDYGSDDLIGMCCVELADAVQHAGMVTTNTNALNTVVVLTPHTHTHTCTITCSSPSEARLVS